VNHRQVCCSGPRGVGCNTDTGTCSSF
jgi:hypothetical protein